MKSSKLFFLIFSFSSLICGLNSIPPLSDDLTCKEIDVEQIVEFFKNNREKIEIEIEEGIQNDLLPSKIVDNIFDVLEKNGFENHYFSKLLKRIRNGAANMVLGTGELIAYPFKKAGEKLGDAWHYVVDQTMGKVTGFANWINNYCKCKWLMFLGAWWLMKSQFKFGWWYLRGKFSKKTTIFWTVFGVLVATATVVTGSKKIYDAGYVICKELGYCAAAAVV